MISLSTKNKLGFIDGIVHKPAPGIRELGAWERCNSMLISWNTLGVLDQNLALSVLYFHTS